jgi:hypothetical protein
MKNIASDRYILTGTSDPLLNWICCLIPGLFGMLMVFLLLLISDDMMTVQMVLPPSLLLTSLGTYRGLIKLIACRKIHQEEELSTNDNGTKELRRITDPGHQPIMKPQLAQATSGRLRIKSQSLPARCEICHQSDSFTPTTNSCSRCQQWLKKIPELIPGDPQHYRRPLFMRPNGTSLRS